MPRAKAEPSQAAKTFEIAKTNHEKAAAALAKQDNAANKKAMEHAEETLKAAKQTLARENFERVGGGRVAKAISAIQNVGKVAKPRVYSYSDADISKMEQALVTNVANVISSFRAAKGGAKEQKKAGFSF